MKGLSLLRHACRVWPHHPLANRQQIHNLRQKYVEKVLYLGDRYLLARNNYVQRKSA